MKLADKMERELTCAYFNPRRSSTGSCNLSGYAPFDCGKCDSYKEACWTKNASSEAPPDAAGSAARQA